MELTFLGTNALLLKKTGSALLVDPHFTRPGLMNLLTRIRPNRQAVHAGLARAGIQRLDAVLLTHTHYDHALDSIEVLRQAGGTLYGSESSLNLARGGGLAPEQCVQVEPGLQYTPGGFKVHFHPSRHIPFPAPFSWLMPEDGQIAQPLSSPAWFGQYQCGTVYAIQVDRILIFGSAGFTPGAYRDLKIERVVLGIGGLELKPGTYLQQLYQEAVLYPGAMQVYLSHWDNFFRPVGEDLRPLGLAQRTIDQIAALGKRHGQTVQVLQYGETVRF